MCGRYVRKEEPKKVAEFLGVNDGEESWTQSFRCLPVSRCRLSLLICLTGTLTCCLGNPPLWIWSYLMIS